VRLPKPFYRLPVRFDVARLRAEVEALPASAWVNHPNDIAGNTSLRLISVNGGENDDLRGPMLPTPHLRASPYLRQVLASFGVVWSRSRLMRLAPHAQVPEHADASYHWFNRVRLHIPVITRPEVRFHCDGVDVHMAAGEAWLFDNWRRHHVDNPTDDARIHLVADTTGTAAFWQYVVQSEHAKGERTIAYQPGVEAQFATERVSPRPVMPPAEVELLLKDLVAELTVADSVPEAAQHLSRYAGLLNGFCLDWRQLYLAYGEDPTGARQYGELVESLRAATKSIAHGLVMRTNHVAAQAVLESRLLQHVFRPEDLGGATPAARPASRHIAPGVARNRPQRPVFVVAAPRSGSTLLFETLAESRQLCTLGGEAHWLVEGISALRPGAPGVDSNRLEAAHATADVGQAIEQALWSRMVDSERRPVDAVAARSLRWLEKTPKNALRIPFLERLFPDALFVFLWRDPRENVSSIMEAWRAGGWVTYPALDGWDGPWSMLLPPGWRALRGRPLEEVAAFQWQRTNAIILDDLAVRPQERWMALSYADLLDDTPSAVARICDFAGLEFDAALAARTGAALPASRHTLTEPAPEKWRQNEAAVLRVLPSLEATWRRLEALPPVTRRSGSRSAR
jgi:hypothetical protein